MLGVVNAMSIEPEVQQKFNEIDEDLKDYNVRIRSLELEMAKQGETLEYIKQSNDEIKDNQKRMENNSLQNQNSVLSILNQLVINKNDNDTQLKINQINNESQKNISKIDNKTKIIIAGLGIFSGSVGCIIASIKFLN